MDHPPLLQIKLEHLHKEHKQPLGSPKKLRADKFLSVDDPILNVPEDIVAKL